MDQAEPNRGRGHPLTPLEDRLHAEAPPEAPRDRPATIVVPEKPAPGTTDDGTMILPLLPLRNTVLFPHLFVPLSVGRPNSLAAIEAVLNTEDKTFIVAAQKDSGNEEPGFADLYPVGTRAVIKKMARNEGVIELIVQGVERVRLLEVVRTMPFLEIRFAPYPLPVDGGTEVEAMQRAVVDLAVKVLELA